MNSKGLLQSKRQEILNLAARHGARNGRAFGSVARGEAGAQSDVDLLVDMEDGRSLLDIVAFWQAVEELLGCRVDVIRDGGINPYLRERIYAEEVPLRKTDAFTCFTSAMPFRPYSIRPPWGVSISFRTRRRRTRWCAISKSSTKL